MSQFKKKLRVVFDKGAPSDGNRYIPLYNGNSEFGWGVFDRKENKFLSDADVKRVPIERLQYENLTGGDS